MIFQRINHATIIAATVGIIGAVVLIASHAAGTPAAFEPETGQFSSNVSVIDMTTASGGKIVRFGEAVSSGGFGMSVPLLPEQSVAVQQQWLTDMKALGITWIRIDIDWWTVQPDGPAGYNWSRYDTTLDLAQRNGLKVLGIIAYTPPWARSAQCAQDPKCQPADFNVYANYAKTVVQRYGNQLSAIEIWNEPNALSFWRPTPNATTYASMLKAAYTAVKSVVPSMPVLTGGTAPACTCNGNISPIDFATGLYGAGAKNYFDGLAHHPYSYPAPPNDVQPWSSWSQMTQTSPSIRGVMTANGDGSKLLWLTEAGAPTNGPGAVATCSNYNYGGSPDHVDDCLQSLILTQVVQNVKAVSWDGVTFFYSYQDNNSNDPSTVENHFGIVRSNGSQKPSYAALKNSLQ